MRVRQEERESERGTFGKKRVRKSEAENEKTWENKERQSMKKQKGPGPVHSSKN